MSVPDVHCTCSTGSACNTGMSISTHAVHVLPAVQAVLYIIPWGGAVLCFEWLCCIPCVCVWGGGCCAVF